MLIKINLMISKLMTDVLIKKSLTNPNFLQIEEDKKENHRGDSMKKKDRQLKM